MSEIKAIETTYNGYRFRSRLEARWAVFFDAAGIRYEYENEGLDLGSAGRYLPDFFLVGLSCWFEVKDSGFVGRALGRAEESRESKEFDKILAAADSGRIVLACGDPWPSSELSIIGPDFIYSCCFAEDLASNAITLIHVNGEKTDLNTKVAETLRSPRLALCYEAARGARFEFGQTPKVPQVQP